VSLSLRDGGAAAVALVLVLVLALGGCATASRSRHAATTSTTTTTTTTVPVPSSTTTTAPAPSTTTSGARSSVASPGPVFRSSAVPIDAAQASTMSSSWRPGCPVGLGDLRVLTVAYLGFDGASHDGRLVVNTRAVAPLTTVFGRLFAARFPIERMQPIDAFGGDDDASVAADNTSSFNCRPPDGGTGWSQHAFGLAIDVNPLRNPYVHADGSVKLAGSRPWVDRSQRAPGMVHAGDTVVQAFAAVGWGWGGSWAGAHDYQHFSANGH
jgi:hypothetical protein